MAAMIGIEAASKVLTTTLSPIAQAEIQGVQSLTMFTPNTNTGTVTVTLGTGDEAQTAILGKSETQIFPNQKKLLGVNVSSSHPGDVVGWFAPWDNPGLGGE
jgi:hypothetical protein